MIAARKMTAMGGVGSPTSTVTFITGSLRDCMPTTATIELARLQDAKVIARMSATLIEYGLARSWTAERVARYIRDRNSAVVVARVGGNVVGFAIMAFNDETAHLNLLGVSSGMRRRGIGRQLLKWLHESAVVAGTFKIRLELRAGNMAARRFYTALGYEESGYVPKYYSDTEDAIRMSRDLSVAPQRPLTR